MPEKLIRIPITLCLFSVFMALLHCKAADKNKQDSKISFEELVKSKLGAKYTVDYNVSKTYALCQQQREGDHSRRTFNYMVVQLSDTKITHEGSYSLGYVKWVDNTSIEVFTSSLQDKDKIGRKEIIEISSNQH